MVTIPLARIADTGQQHGRPGRHGVVGQHVNHDVGALARGRDIQPGDGDEFLQVEGPIGELELFDTG